MLGEKHPLYALSLINLASFYQAMEKPIDALGAAQQALRVLDGERRSGLAAHVEQHGDFLDRMAGTDDERRRQYA